MLSEAAGKEISQVLSEAAGKEVSQVFSVSRLREAAINIAGSENVIDTAIVISGEFNDDMDRSAPAVRLVVTIGGRGNVQHL